MIANGSIPIFGGLGLGTETIGKAKIGTRTFTFDKGERDAANAFARPHWPWTGTGQCVERLFHPRDHRLTDAPA